MKFSTTTSILALLPLITCSPIAHVDDYSKDKAPQCPSGGDLPATYLNPTLLVPISAHAPNVKFGPTKNPLITPNDICTIINFIVPPSAADKTCTLEFLFPDHSQTPNPYSYFVQGQEDHCKGGHFTFTGYAFGSGALANSTYNDQPPSGPSPPTPPAILSPGNAYTINVGSCGVTAEMEGGLEVSGKLCSNDTTFSYLQSDRPCALGFFVGIS